MDVREIFAGNAEHDRVIVVADRQHDVAARAARGGRRATTRFDGEDRRRLGRRFASCSQLALDRQHRFLERDLQVVGVHDLAVVRSASARVGFSYGETNGSPPISSSSGVVKNTICGGNR